MQSTVVVTGANGYIAAHIIQLLLQKNYKVVGTVRSLKSKSKYSHLFNLCPSKNKNLTLKEGDLSNEKVWDSIIEGSDYVIHTASPFPLVSPKNASEIIIPVVKGVRAIMKACIQNKVKKIVYTSSLLTVFGGRYNKTDFSEDDWCDPKLISSYDQSKYYGEQEAWKMLKENKGELKLTVILPAFVIGPCFNDGDFASGDMLINILNNEIWGYPRHMNCLLVDVRDVALAHVLALEKNITDNKRYCLIEGSYPFTRVMDAMKNEFKRYGYKFARLKFGSCLLKIASLFDRKLEFLLPFLNREIYVDNTKSIKELGITYNNTLESLIEMGYSLIDKGKIENKLNSKIMVNVLLDMCGSKL